MTDKVINGWMGGWIHRQIGSDEMMLPDGTHRQVDRQTDIADKKQWMDEYCIFGYIDR